ncbi:hypothetical protein [Mucilaginibacter glaciei]|uniref:Uncharacterized protein n=1 Tax=Mucilaginibacter glaciei TaxID=2772109 RepID=A0A926NVX8_9SPHI|nr:hypothetical protein [Mucilaginibacter glaciei]MBD1392704.1 hypothetical protein [Mucilaginibacter glaciei]
MTASPKKSSKQSTPDAKSYTGRDNYLNTEMPLSEKDEVKKAEERIAKSTKPPRKF